MQHDTQNVISRWILRFRTNSGAKNWKTSGKWTLSPGPLSVHSTIEVLAYIESSFRPEKHQIFFQRLWHRLLFPVDFH